jgi:hypothetical protein
VLQFNKTKQLLELKPYFGCAKFKMEAGWAVRQGYFFEQLLKHAYFIRAGLHNFQDKSILVANAHGFGNLIKKTFASTLFVIKQLRNTLQKGLK